MKKITNLLFVILLLLCSCSKDNDNTGDDNGGSNPLVPSLTGAITDNEVNFDNPKLKCTDCIIEFQPATRLATEERYASMRLQFNDNVEIIINSVADIRDVKETDKVYRFLKYCVKSEVFKASITVNLKNDDVIISSETFDAPADADWWSFASDDSYFTINLNLNGKEYKYSGTFKYEFPEDSVEEQIKFLVGKWKPIYYGGNDPDDEQLSWIYNVNQSNMKSIRVRKDDILEFKSDGTVYYWDNGTTDLSDDWFNGTYYIPNYNYEFNRVEATYTVKFKRVSADKTHNIYCIDYYLSSLKDDGYMESHTLEYMFLCTYKYENGILTLNDEASHKWFTFKRA
ncbi:hypothetical protein [Bacteroides fragilis]|uniref:Lipoprotein n=1 Tax=Bacteroides fragilis TaxID=817 RepID=A0A853PTG5_BACFG|nr:hypothetical protein [Bacteroides fragilis]EYA39795.1 putative lipoprotein [Bacteroides fragilis str. 20793-3]MCS2358836.1 hypothetical protein [Bacteroides fragilis]OCR29877.1 hypothetical protein AC094_29520 [Bacteroides fragilis]PJY66309.1 hypothetical protein CQW35_01630 [Bacteroides fragilis]